MHNEPGEPLSPMRNPDLILHASLTQDTKQFDGQLHYQMRQNSGVHTDKKILCSPYKMSYYIVIYIKLQMLHL